MDMRKPLLLHGNRIRQAKPELLLCHLQGTGPQILEITFRGGRQTGAEFSFTSMEISLRHPMSYHDYTQALINTADHLLYRPYDD